MYPTREQIIAGSNNAALLALTADQQEALRLQSIGLIEHHTKQSFDTAVLAIEPYDGSGSDTIYLRKRLSTLVNLEVRGVSLSAESVLLDEKRSKLTIRRTAGNAYERAMAEMDGPVGTFRSGRGNVLIEGLWGWQDVEFPQDVGTALRLDMEDTATGDASGLAETIQSYRAQGVRTIRQGNLTAEIGPAPGLSSRAIRLLADYVWTGPIGVAV